jgi:hypothetical protein
MPGLAMIVFVISEMKKSFSKASMLIYISAAVVAILDFKYAPRTQNLC